MTTYLIYEAADKLGISVSVLRREIYKKSSQDVSSVAVSTFSIRISRTM